MSSTPKKVSIKRIDDSEDELRLFRDMKKDAWDEYINSANTILNKISWVTPLKLITYKKWIDDNNDNSNEIAK